MPFNPDTFFIVHVSLFATYTGGAINVSVYDLAVTGWNAQDAGGQAIPAQVVTTQGLYGAPGAANHIEDRQVQWCGYAQDQILYSVLPGAGGPDIMLTPTMDGCSFGIGHSAGDGSTIVTHANKASAQTAVNTTAEMQGAQQKAIKAFYKTQQEGLKYVLKPDDYRWAMDNGQLRTVGMASTYGVRNNAHWRFYEHAYTDNMGTYQYIGNGPRRIKD